MQTTQDSIEAAFGLLEAAVAEGEREGRVVLAASLKPRLQRRSGGWFDEAKLGFPRFQLFLEAARDRGLIAYERTPGGDFLVSTVRPTATAPAGGDAPSSPPVHESSAALRNDPSKRMASVRQDLWKAFFDWRTRFNRYYDRDRDQAFLTTRTEPASARYVPIQPIALEQQLDWMREFAAGIDGPDRSDLQAALATERPLASFASAIRHRPVSADWHALRLERVIEAIESWMNANGVETNVLETRTPGGLGWMADEEALRAAVHQAVARMPLGELLRLPIALEYLIRRS